MTDKHNSLLPRHSEMDALAQRGYIMGAKIGQGSYATVHLANYQDPRTDKHQQLACKIFDKDRAPQDFLDKFFPRELDILTKLENQYIIQVHSILQRGPRIFIFMRYAENGDLLGFVKRHGIVAEQNAKEWFRQMASGIQYLHSKQIAHRDLKCENILLTRRYNVKLTDFGFARYCVDMNGLKVLSQTYCGSAAYAAPEVVCGTPYNPKMADIWSLGIILFIMLNASMPFNDDDLKALLREQVAKKYAFRTKVKDILSSNAISMVDGILEPDLAQRFSLDSILSHSWLKSSSQQSRNSSISSWQPVSKAKNSDRHMSPSRRPTSKKTHCRLDSDKI